MRSFQCFGTRCAVHVDEPAAGEAEALLLAWHARFSRFVPESELSQLNADPRERVPVSPLMARFARAARAAAELTGGLVDPTLVREIEDAGYRTDLGAPLDLPLALRLAPPRRPAAPHPAERWRSLRVEAVHVGRPPGVQLDSGGVAKGLFADLLADRFEASPSFVVDCGGDLRIGGSARRPRPVDVRSPFAPDQVLHRFVLRAGGVATSGIATRSWRDPAGRPAHHLLDPATGCPAFTGIVQATALAPTAAEAETRAKAALLAGPAAAEHWLPHGGLLVLDDATHRVVPSCAGSDPA